MRIWPACLPVYVSRAWVDSFGGSFCACAVERADREPGLEELSAVRFSGHERLLG
jgi:hypothetical protein